MSSEGLERRLAQLEREHADLLRRFDSLEALVQTMLFQSAAGPAPPAAPPRARSPLPGERYLVAALGELLVGVPLEVVREVLEMAALRPVPDPQAVPALRGVLELRGESVAVFDLRWGLELSARRPDVQTSVVVVQHQGQGVGLQVDEVLGVHDLEPSDLRPPPEGCEADYLAGVLLLRQGESARQAHLLDPPLLLAALRAAEALELAELAEPTPAEEPPADLVASQEPPE